MTVTAATAAEANAIAVQLRAVYRDTDFVVTVVEPLFVGDLYRINVE